MCIGNCCFICSNDGLITQGNSIIFRRSYKYLYYTVKVSNQFSACTVHIHIITMYIYVRVHMSYKCIYWGRGYLYTENYSHKVYNKLPSYSKRNSCIKHFHSNYLNISDTKHHLCTCNCWRDLDAYNYPCRIGLRLCPWPLLPGQL